VKSDVQVEEASEDGKVLVKLIKKGKNYKRPNEGATVKLAYTARVGGPDGPIFEEASKEKPFTFVTDEGEKQQELAVLLIVLHPNNQVSPFWFTDGKAAGKYLHVILALTVCNTRNI